MSYTPLGSIYKVPRYLYEAMINTFRGIRGILRERYEELLIFREDGTVHIKNPGWVGEWFMNRVDALKARGEVITPKNLEGRMK